MGRVMIPKEMWERTPHPYALRSKGGFETAKHDEGKQTSLTKNNLKPIKKKRIISSPENKDAKKDNKKAKTEGKTEILDTLIASEKKKQNNQREN